MVGCGDDTILSELKILYYEGSDSVKGHICKCGEEHKWPAYVYSHWEVPLVHKCPKCGLKADILKGEIAEVSDEDRE